jgi:predicted  nucleic acid-binding Zn-ribbon protein
MHNFLICKKHGHTRWSKKGEYGRVIEPKKSERLCPKCKKERQYAWRHECNKCGKLFYNTKGVGGTGPIKCKQRDRFRVMSTKKMSNPEQEIHFAAIRADVFHQNDMARATVLVANLKDEKFLEGRWADNGSCIYRTEQLDTSDILNADKLIKLMWEQI